MRFMIIVKASKDSEAGILPSEKLLAEWSRAIGESRHVRNPVVSDFRA